jgi:hypothetical protein
MVGSKAWEKWQNNQYTADELVKNDFAVKLQMV